MPISRQAYQQVVERQLQELEVAVSEARSAKNRNKIKIRECASALLAAIHGSFLSMVRSMADGLVK